jgi:hypothetical protein
MAATDGGRLSKDGGRVATYDVRLDTDVATVRPWIKAARPVNEAVHLGMHVIDFG